MKNLKSKIKKIENKICPGKEWVIFKAGGPNRDEDFERQMAEYLENGGDPLTIGLDWEIHEYTDGTVFVADYEGGQIYTLKPASQKIKKLYNKGKHNQYSHAGDLGMHT